MSTSKSKRQPSGTTNLPPQSAPVPKLLGSETPSDYTETVFRFVDNINTVRHSANIYIPISIKISKETHKEIIAAIESLKSLLKGDAPQLSRGDAIKSLKTIEKFSLYDTLGQTGLLARSLFLSMFSFFDAFIGDLLAAIYRQRPALLEATDKTLTLREIMKYESFDSLRQQIIHKEIENFRRESYIEQFRLLESKFGIKSLRQFEGWTKFVECSQRRNLLTHCDGVVSEQYLQICQRENCLPTPPPKLGETLSLQPDYFYESVDVVHEVGFKLAQTLWRHQVPEQLETAESVLNEHMQKLLNQERWSLAEIIGKFGFDQKRFSSDARRRMVQIKYAQALKWGGKAEAAKNLINSSDWSSCVPDLRMCAAIILDDFRNAAKFMRQSGKHGEHVSEIDYIDWPLFREFRKSVEFESAHRDVYNMDFEDSLKQQIGHRFVVPAEQKAQPQPSGQAEQPKEGVGGLSPEGE